MKKVFSGLLAICFLLMGACGSGNTVAVTTLPGAEPPPSLTAAIQPTASSETSPEIEMIQLDPNELEPGDIESAEECRATAGGYEYYFDTTKPVIEKDLEDMYPDPDFPLMKKKTGKTDGVFLGVYGSCFTIQNDYLYIDSNDLIAGDYGWWTTRALSLKDGVISEELYSVDLYFPAEGNKVCYVEFPGSAIYYCEPDLTIIEEYPVFLPNIENILDTLKTMGYDDNIKEDYFEYYIYDLEIKDGWIYFTYEMCEPPQLTAYTGYYRMLSNGTKIEQTNDGEFTQRSDYWAWDDEED